VGLFSGKKVNLTLCPAEENFKIVFQREDLEGKPIIQANLDNVTESIRCTSLGGKNGVQMVEHLLSALYAFGIDNLLIKVNGPEIVCGDGSAMIFVNAIEKAGVKDLKEKKKQYTLRGTYSFADKETTLVALPANNFQISYVLHYPNVEVLQSRYFLFNLDEGKYKEALASCRTFSTYEDVKPLLDRGIIKGGDLDNAVVIKDGQVINSTKLRYPDEMVRHKVLDLIGDFALMGKTFNAHIVAIRSGHAANIMFAKRIYENFIEGKE
jgi:UDP-3-O-[3-hydroxymyristoyl] N-acetylglucosamine deacetylase